MGRLWVPPAVDRDLAERTRQARVEMLEMFELRGPVQASWNPELERIDVYLKLGKAKDNAHAPGVVPGFWHLLRDAPGAPVSVLPIHGPQFEYVEPSLAILEKLRRGDLQNPTVVREHERQQAEAERAKEKEQATDAEERREELVERVKAATETRVSFNPDAPWTQGVAGRRGARKREG